MAGKSKRELYRDLFAEAGYLEKGYGSKQEILKLVEAKNLKFPQWLLEYKVDHGKYNVGKFLAEWDGSVSKPVIPETGEKKLSPSVESAQAITSGSYVPEKFDGYVPFGYFNDLSRILTSLIFYPVFITGLSGNGKTLMVEQVCASLGREMIRANITAETDEDDLIGGFRLINGETVWQDGPVLIAMQRGAILLLDEVDLGTPKLMCLQPVLEGKSIYVKKIGKVFHPTKGFNVVATANTKGKGSSSGMFIGTMVMNEAFLERFAITFEQQYPEKNTEIEILKNELSKQGTVDDYFAETLVKWADLIRISFVNGDVSDVISTRRLTHIVNARVIFDDRAKALHYGLARFNSETSKTFMESYTKVDGELAAEMAKAAEAEAARKQAELNALKAQDKTAAAKPSATSSAAGTSAGVPSEVQKHVDYLNNNPDESQNADLVRVIKSKASSLGYEVAWDTQQMKWVVIKK